MRYSPLASRLVAAVVLTVAGTACSGANGIVPTAPTPTPLPSASASTFILFGVVTEATPSGSVPIEGAQVDVSSCEQSNRVGCANPTKSATTDARGLYAVPGVYSGAQNLIWVTKAGFELPSSVRADGEGAQLVNVKGDTRFDVQLVRR